MKSHVSYAGLVRVLEKRLLTTDVINKVADTTSLEEALRLVASNCDYDFASLEFNEDYEEVLIKKLKETYDFAFSVAEKEVVKILSMKHDFNNLKIAIKANVLKENNAIFSYVTDVNPDEMLKLFEENESLDKLPDYIINGFNKAIEVLEETNDPQDVSIFLDKYMFNQMLEYANVVDNELITDYVKAVIDIYNIKSLIRCKNLGKEFAFFNILLADGGKILSTDIRDFYNKSIDQIKTKLFYKYLGNYTKEGLDVFEKDKSLHQLEKQLDNYLIDKLKSAKYIAFGPELIFAYVANKENEAMQIRILLTGVMNQIPSEVLKERLRENYA